MYCLSIDVVRVLSDKMETSFFSRSNFLSLAQCSISKLNGRHRCCSALPLGFYQKFYAVLKRLNKSSTFVLRPNNQAMKLQLIFYLTTVLSAPVANAGALKGFKASCGEFGLCKSNQVCHKAKGCIALDECISTKCQLESVDPNTKQCMSAPVDCADGYYCDHIQGCVPIPTTTQAPRFP